MKKKYYLVEEKDMINLLDSYLHYLALEQGGVGDWEWYYMSLGEFIDRHKLDHGIRYTIRDMAKEEVYYLVFNLDKDLPEVYACSKCLSKQYILRKGKINKEK